MKRSGRKGRKKRKRQRRGEGRREWKEVVVGGDKVSRYKGA